MSLAVDADIKAILRQNDRFDPPIAARNIQDLDETNIRSKQATGYRVGLTVTKSRKYKDGMLEKKQKSITVLEDRLPVVVMQRQ